MPLYISVPCKEGRMTTQVLAMVVVQEIRKLAMKLSALPYSQVAFRNRLYEANFITGEGREWVILRVRDAGYTLRVECGAVVNIHYTDDEWRVYLLRNGEPCNTGELPTEEYLFQLTEELKSLRDKLQDAIRHWSQPCNKLGYLFE